MLTLREPDSFLGSVTLTVAAKEELPFLSYNSSTQKLFSFFVSMYTSRILIHISRLRERDTIIGGATMVAASKAESPLSAYSCSK